MNRNRCATTIGMCELLVGAALPDLSEAQSDQDRDDFARLENRKPRHLGGDRLDPYEFALQLGFAILEEHCDDFTEVLGQLFLRLSLGVSAGKPGDVADQKPRLGIALNYGREFSHYSILSVLRRMIHPLQLEEPLSSFRHHLMSRNGRVSTHRPR